MKNSNLRTFTIKEIFSVYFRCLGDSKKLIPIQNFLVVLDGVLQACVPAILGYVVDRLIDNPAVFVEEELSSIVLLCCGGSAFFYLLAVSHHYLGTKISTTIGVNIRLDLYRHLQKLSADFYQRHHVGEVSSRLTNDVNTGVLPIYGLYYTMLWALSVVIPSCIALFMISGPFITLFIGFIGFLALLIRMIMPSLRILNRHVGEETGRISASVTEEISANQLTRTFARESEAYEGLFQQNQVLLAKVLKAAKRSFILGDFLNTFNAFIAPLGLLFVGSLFIGQGLTVGALVAAYGYWNRAAGPVTSIINSSTQFFTSLSSLDRLLEFFAEQPSVKDQEGAHPLKVDQGNIMLNGVTFSYPVDDEDSKTVINNLSLHIPSKSSTALIGGSGAGKSTLVQLILRLYDPKNGSIVIDGQDLREVTQSSLRKSIGLVMQETILLSGSVRDNLKFAQPDSNDDQIIQALKDAEAWDFVKQLPEGLDTAMGERGSRLSGGQKQRLSIARVFLKNPPVVIFDEATSALDTLTEQAIQRSMKRLFKGRTSIVIAHRLSTVVDCDQLVLMESGNYSDRGTHLELLNRNRTYQEMCQGQSL